MPFVLPVECGCAKYKRVSSIATFNRFRVSRVDKSDKADSVRRNRIKIKRDQVAVRRHLMIDGTRVMSKMLRSFFRQKLEEFCARVEHHMKHGLPKKSWDAKAVTELDFGPNESVFKTAIEEILGSDADVELTIGYRPIVQSVAAKAHERTSILLGEDGSDPDSGSGGDLGGATAAQGIYNRATKLAQRVTRINDTTRERLASTIRNAMNDGLTIRETVDSIRDDIPEIADGRIPTIARTEVGNAIDEGTKQSLLDSDTVTYVSVIGCTGVEENGPCFFDGIPTCNIVNVEVSRVDELEFHPCHQGTIVASQYVGDGEFETEEGTPE